MKRSYYLVQSLDAAKQLQASLVKNAISNDQIHALCKDDSLLAPVGLTELPLTQRKDIFADIEYGGLIGILVGLLLALAMIPLPAETIDLNPVVFSGIVFAFGLTGLMLGALIGLTRENYHISEFRTQISGEQCVLMIDDPDNNLPQLIANSGVEVQYLKEDDDSHNVDEASAVEGVPMTQ